MRCLAAIKVWSQTFSEICKRSSIDLIHRGLRSEHEAPPGHGVVQIDGPLEPVRPMTPVGVGKATRGVEFDSVDDLEARQISVWMDQAASVTGVGELPSAECHSGSGAV
ncbi:hypothetical protein SAMN05216368_10335 [Cryobacterium flavum]|uniref:Uncharacterized protein n=1 Tax=Cryobacterium flavum TaxID=1424659 RepID=A0A5E9FVA5_9MICO|nr:hypothetical protein SAMN05216368_10335 [Cryobacterium flavum]